MSPCKLLIALLSMTAAASAGEAGPGTVLNYFANTIGEDFPVRRRSAEPLPPGVVAPPKALRGRAPRRLMPATGVLGEHDMECGDAGTYSSIVCHYCIDVPKLVCESICASGLDQTPSNCNWSPWWAWHGISGGGEGWCCGGY